MTAVESAKVNGAELVKKLAATGTGAAKLELARNLLAFLHRKEGRVATANEVLDALEKGGCGEVTMRKARAIAETGGWSPAPRPPEVMVEDLLLAGQALPPVAVKSAVEQAQEVMDAGPLAAAEESPVELKKVKKKPAAE